MTIETWTDVSEESDAWVGIADSENGYVVANYVRGGPGGLYVDGVSGASWSDLSDASNTWTSV